MPEPECGVRGKTGRSTKFSFHKAQTVSASSNLTGTGCVKVSVGVASNFNCIHTEDTLQLSHVMTDAILLQELVIVWVSNSNLYSFLHKCRTLCGECKQVVQEIAALKK